MYTSPNEEKKQNISDGKELIPNGAQTRIRSISQLLRQPQEKTLVPESMSIQKSAPNKLSQIKKRLSSTLKIQRKPTANIYMSQLFTQSNNQKSQIFSSRSEKVQMPKFNQKYEVGKKIGRGAQGEVRICMYKNKKSSNSKKFVVKIEKMNEEYVQRYKKNFAQVLFLKHPNIVKYKALYLCPQNRMSYLIMEYIQYPTLKDYKVENQDQLRNVSFLILEALQYIHKKNIAHRDIKPQNIHYCKQTNRLKIIDFGLCNKHQNFHQQCQMLSNSGTQQYKAPQMLNSQFYSQKVDIWALGMIMIKLVTGKNPVESPYKRDMLQNIQNFKVDFSASCWQIYSSSCKQLISNLLEKDKVKRFNSQQALNHFFFQNLKVNATVSERYKKKNLVKDYILSLQPVKARKNPEQKQSPSGIITFVESDEEDDGMIIHDKFEKKKEAKQDIEQNNQDQKHKI